MTVDVSCSACGGAFKVAEQHVGKKAKCPKCGERFLIVAPPDGDEPVLADLDWQSPVPISVSPPPPPPVPPPQQFATATPAPSNPAKADQPLATKLAAVVILGIICFCGCSGLISMFNGNGNKSRVAATPPVATAVESVPTAPTAPKETMIRIAVEDGTKSNPVPPDAALFLYEFGEAGSGVWKFQPELKFGGSVQVFGPREVNQMFDKTLAIHFWPDGYKGPDGPKQLIPFLLPADMPSVDVNPEGSVKHMITITFEDDRIEVFGLPIEAATGNLRMYIDRRQTKGN